jgi:hypothetical protein
MNMGHWLPTPLALVQEKGLYFKAPVTRQVGQGQDLKNCISHAQKTFNFLFAFAQFN